VAEQGPLLASVRRLLDELEVWEVLALPEPPLPVRLWRDSDTSLRVDLLIRLGGSERDDQQRVLGELAERGLRSGTWTGRAVLGSADVEDLPKLIDNDLEALVDASPVVRPALDISVPEAWHVGVGELPSTWATGRGVVVGLVDSGIDLAHASFRDANGATRVLRYWNQTAEGIGVKPRFGYGREWVAAAIDTQLSSGTMPTAWVDPTGHGTLVAGVAAGNGRASPSGRDYGGVAPDADLIVVALEARQNAFADSNNLVDGVEYVFEEAGKLGRRAVVNVSQGVQIGAHVPADGLETALAELLARDDKGIVVVSSGNTGELDAHARIHVPDSGTVELVVDVPRRTGPWVLIDLWYDIADGLDVEVLDPMGSGTGVADGRRRKTGGVGNGTYEIDGTPNVRGPRANRIQVKLLSPARLGDVSTGSWVLRLHGRSMTSGAPVDVWLDRGARMVSPRFEPADADADCTITSPATADGVIAVSSYTVRPTIGPFAGSSGRGPDRIGVAPPLLAAPGQTIISSAASNVAATPYAPSQGTSLAAAHVTGAIALMLEAKPSMTRDEVRDCLTASARTDPDTAAGPASGWGAGKLDIDAALVCAATK
jgi:subtilisin family serine protease